MKNPKIDQYIQKSEKFAQPILKHLRKLVHRAVPGAEENIKWGMPFFVQEGLICGMAAFKEHCALGFPKAQLMKDPKGILGYSDDSMGNLGRIITLKDLPADSILVSYFKQAAELNRQGLKVTRKKVQNKPLTVPASLKSALKANKKAQKTFEDFSYTNQKEYVTWITEAKTEETRERRLEQTIEWLEEGKPRNWKYMKK